MTRTRRVLRRSMALALILGVAAVLCAPAWHHGPEHLSIETSAPSSPSSGDALLSHRSSASSGDIDACAVCISQRILSQAGIHASTGITGPACGEDLSPGRAPIPLAPPALELHARAPPLC